MAELSIVIQQSAKLVKNTKSGSNSRNSSQAAHTNQHLSILDSNDNTARESLVSRHYSFRAQNEFNSKAETSFIDQKKMKSYLWMVYVFCILGAVASASCGIYNLVYTASEDATFEKPKKAYLLFE